METEVILNLPGSHGGSVEIALTKQQYSFIGFLSMQTFNMFNDRGEFHHLSASAPLNMYEHVCAN